MEVARLHAVGDLRVGDEQVPAPRPGMSLVRVTGIGICGSDLHWWGEAGIGDAVFRAPLAARHRIDTAAPLVNPPLTGHHHRLPHRPE